jgi:hypothetical protein
VSKVAYVERTEGTETSKYLQEEKSIEILLVAASERKLAQTSMRACWGCRTCIKGSLLGEGLGSPTIGSESLVSESEQTGPVS